MSGTYTIQDFGPSDLLTSEVEGERKVKVESSFSDELTTNPDRGDNGLNVYIQDQKTSTLSVPFVNERDTATLAAPLVVNERTATLTPGFTAAVGNIMEIASSDGLTFMQSEITAINGNDVTVDCPFNFPYAVSATVVISSREMTEDGSVTPVIFSVLPLPQQKGDIVRVTFEMQDNADMNFSTFAGAAQLTNGCVLRVNKGDGTYKNIFNFKNNGDIIAEAYDSTFLDANAQQIRGFSSRLTWGGPSKHGVVIPLDGSLGESLEMVIQDDLTGITRFRMKAQGHEPE